MSSTVFNPAILRRIVRAGTASSFGSRPGMRRHHWTELELQELSLAYLEHRNQMPLWKIAEMLEFSFASPKPVHQEDDDDAPITPKTPKTPKTPGTAAAHTRAPSVQAITSKADGLCVSGHQRPLGLQKCVSISTSLPGLGTRQAISEAS